MSPDRTHPVRSALLLSLLMVAMLTVYAIYPYSSTPEDIAEGYLDLLQEGDLNGALDYVGDTERLGEASEQFLVKEAVSSDWDFTIDSVRRDGPVADVDYVLEFPGIDPESGRFRLHQTGLDWDIMNPFVLVDTTESTVAYLSAREVTSNEDQLWLLPGLYEFYPEKDGIYVYKDDYRLVTTYGSLLALENSLEDEYHMHSPRFSPNALAGTFDSSGRNDFTNEHFAGFGEACESLESFDDPACPLHMWTPRDIVGVGNASIDINTIVEIQWRVTEDPVFELAPGSLRLEMVEEGTVTVTVTDQDGTEYSTECAVTKTDGDVRMDGPNELNFDFKHVETSC